MKRKFTVLVMICLAFASTTKAQYNFFSASDVDADGWIWFDTQEKIDKYISQANNEEMKFDENGKPIQLVVADFDPYEDSMADPTFIGVGTDQNPGGTGAKTGAIKLAPASNANGGGVLVHLPSCTSFNVFISCEAKFKLALKGSESNVGFNDYTTLRSYSVFPLPGTGQKTWTGMETLETTSGFKLAQSTEVYAYIQNWTTYPLYVHGMKILTSTPTNISNTEVNSSAISFDGKTLSVNEPADINVYTIAGNLAVSDYASSVNLSNLVKGIYVVKVKTTSGQETAKIAIR